MKHNELSNFTHAELANFTHEELALFPSDILRKIREDDRPLPLSVVEKIQSICQALPSEVTKQCRLKNAKEAIETVITIGRYLKLLPELSHEYSSVVQSIIEAIIKYFG